MVAWLMGANLKSRISTNVLDLIPSEPGLQELNMVRSLADQDEARIILLAVRAGTASAPGAPASDILATDLARALASEPAIAQAIPLADHIPRDAIARAIFLRRLSLLLPGWLDTMKRQYDSGSKSVPWPAWLAEKAAQDLEAFLAKPEAIAAQDVVTSDPLLLVPRLANRMEGISGPGFESGQGANYSLVWALSRESPLSEGGQEPVFAAVNDAMSKVRAIDAGAELRWTGVARFAAASRARIEREVRLLNILSLCLVVGVAAACVRKIHRAIHLVPVVLGGLLGAWTVTAAAWHRVHVLVFVIGSLLAGVAVDYGFYLFLQPKLRPSEPYAERARRLVRPLLASALTTVIGFSFLLWSELPLIRQLGVFVSAGLIFALLTALLWFAQIDDSHLDTRSFIRWRPNPAGRGVRLASRLALFAGAVVALAGPWRLHWRDDIRELEIPTPDITANDSAVRSLFGDDGAKTVYLTQGASLADARDNLESFLKWHAVAYPGSKAAAVGMALPTKEQWARLPSERAALADFPGQFRLALERHGFQVESFAPFFRAWKDAAASPTQPPYEAMVRELERSLRGPLSSLVHDAPGTAWFVTIAEQGPGPDPPASTNTVTDSQLQNLNRLFLKYRISALRLSCVGLAFVGASVFVLYGIRRGARIFAIPSGACLFAFGLFGLLGITLNLFNLLGAFLGVCLSHNYAIFTAESLRRHEEPPPSIRMSSLAAASSFGVLSLSRIPVVSALGSTVAVIVIAALAITELTPLASGENTVQRPGQ
jgi:predicted exporter